MQIEVPLTAGAVEGVIGTAVVCEGKVLSVAVFDEYERFTRYADLYEFTFENLPDPHVKMSVKR